MSDITIVSIYSLVVMGAMVWVAIACIRNQKRTIDRQNDTIQRLINRDPVTYQETSQKPPKVIEEVYSAWGGVTVDREIEDSRE